MHVSFDLSPQKFSFRLFIMMEFNPSFVYGAVAGYHVERASLPPKG